MRLRTKLCAFALSWLVSMSATAERESSEAGEQLQALLGNIVTFTAEFRQINADTDAVVAGRLWLKKPGQFRILTQTFGDQWLISDGASLWNYDADLEQVVITRAGTDPAEVPILLFASESADVTSAYQVSGFSDKQLQHFLLEPVTENTLFRSITVAFNESVPVFLSIHALSGQSSTLEIVNPVVNPEVDDDLFQFEVPEGIDVLDDR